MIIKLVNHKLCISQLDSTLQPRHRFQLTNWGFQREDGEFCCLDEKTLLKIIPYFEKEGLSFKLSDTCKCLMERISEARKRFCDLLEKCQGFKNGEFDRADFADHLNFLTANIPRKLKDHQKKAAYHLWLAQNGANFSVPGAGKTSVVLSVYERMRLADKVNVLLVVGPPACFGPWKTEFKVTLGRKPDCTILAGGDKGQRKSAYYKILGNSELYLTTFQTLMNDQEEVTSFLKSQNVRAFLVIDEAHYIKRINGNWANAVLNVAKDAVHRCVLTGTPIPKSYSDLYNLFDFLWPDNNPISSEDQYRLDTLEKDHSSVEAASILEPAVGPLFYRVRKSELGLKEQVTKTELVKMNPEERKIYDAIFQKIKDYSTQDYLKNIDFVEKLIRGRMIRLRQCLSFAKLLSTAIDAYDEKLIPDDADLRSVICQYGERELPGKLTRLLELVNSFQEQGEKVLIWAHFIGTIELIETKLRDAGFRCKKIIGETPIERTGMAEEETREKIRDEFVDKESGLDILLANPAACAESISLHKTCYNAIYYDLSYNCAQYLQSLDRIHRVGGSENQEAYYYILQYEDTIDPDIYSNLDQKAQRMYAIIEGDYNIYSLDMFEDSDELAAYKQLFPQIQ